MNQIKKTLSNCARMLILRGTYVKERKSVASKKKLKKKVTPIHQTNASTKKKRKQTPEESIAASIAFIVAGAQVLIVGIPESFGGWLTFFGIFILVMFVSYLAIYYGKRIYSKKKAEKETSIKGE